MFLHSPILKLFGIDYPIIQAGMVWVSGAKLAAASANAGCLGLIGAGSMKVDLLESQIIKAKNLTNKPFGINIPLLYKDVENQIDVALKQGVRIFFTSAGSPKKFTPYLKDKGCVVVHVCSTPDQALKCEQAGCDAVVAEGFEAGGHNGIDEITTMALIPQVTSVVKIPVIAAGGIASGCQIAAAIALGASAAQIGTRFVCTKESSAHDNFKNYILQSKPSDTRLMMKKLVPVRLLKNKFFEEIENLEKNCVSKEDLANHLGKGRAKLGMLDGMLDDGELEIGQVCSMIRDIPTVKECVSKLINEYNLAVKRLT